MFEDNKEQKQILVLQWLSRFCVGNILLFWIIGLPYLRYVTPLSLNVVTTLYSALVWLYLILAYTSHLALLALLPHIIPWLITSVFPLRHWLTCFAIFLATCAASLLAIDVIVYSQYRFHLNGIIWEMLVKGHGIFDFSWLEWVGIACGWLCLFILQIWYARFLWRNKHFPWQHFRLKRLIIILLGFLLFSYYMFLVSNAQQVSLLAQQSQALPFYNQLLASLLPLDDSQRIIESFGQNNFRQPKKSSGSLHYPLAPLECHANHPFNLLIILIDSWRFDMLNSQVMPKVHHFSQEAQVYRNHWSGGNATQPGIFSLFYGLPGNYWTAMVEKKQGPVLIHELLRQHYQPKVLASAPLTLPAFDQTVFSEIPGLKAHIDGDDPWIRDRQITEQFNLYLKQEYKQPFFGVLFYDSAHSFCTSHDPITLFKPVATICNRLLLTNQTNPIPYVNRYRNALYYIDGLIGQVLANLKHKGLLKNTIVIITGDHGHEFNDNHRNYWGHASNFTRYQVQTPLIIAWPYQPPVVITQQTSHFDIAPLILTQLLNCQNPVQDYSSGIDWLSNKPRPYLLISSYIDFGIVEKDKITRVFPSGGYQIEDVTANLLENASLPFGYLQDAWHEMRRFFK